MEINWTTVLSNAIGGSITGIIVGSSLLILNHSLGRFMGLITANGKNKKEKESKES
jgi:hypothetical protein